MVADLEDVLALEASRSGQAPARSRACCARSPAPRGAALPWRDASPGALGRLACAGRGGRGARADLRRRQRAPRSRRRHRTSPAQAACRRCSSARRPRTTTTRSAPARKIAIRSTTSIDGDPNTKLEHRAVLRRHAAQAGRGRPRDLPRCRARRVAKALEIQTSTPGFAPGLRGRPHRSHCRTATRRRFACAAGTDPSARAPTCTAANRSRCRSRRRLPLLPGVAHDAAARQAAGDDRRGHAVQVGALSSCRGGAAVALQRQPAEPVE